MLFHCFFLLGRLLFYVGTKSPGNASASSDLMLYSVLRSFLSFENSEAGYSSLQLKTLPVCRRRNEDRVTDWPPSCPLRCRTCLVVSCRESLSLCVWENQLMFTWLMNLRPTWTLSRDWWPPGSSRGRQHFYLLPTVSPSPFPHSFNTFLQLHTSSLSSPLSLLFPTCCLPDSGVRFCAGTSSMRRRRRLWWSTTSSWRPTWLTESSCSTVFPPRRPWLTRKVFF